MDNARRDEIKMWAEIHKDLPDGAFLGVMEEHGISPEEIADAYEPQGGDGDE